MGKKENIEAYMKDLNEINEKMDWLGDQRNLTVGERSDFNSRRIAYLESIIKEMLKP